METKRSVAMKFSQNVKLDMEARNHKKHLTQHILCVIYRPKTEKTDFWKSNFWRSKQFYKEIHVYILKVSDGYLFYRHILETALKSGL